ncbi:MAG: FAD-dependent thymidylate synthase [Armatimonadota bacterium]|nr:FAD-dependent thymidylate synthase [Armatimonadota bacterium]MDR7402495.1 FAD-dependent thymidylate synthase [Armatimonadota bacterium]MDR7403727.1 FAD-dependent thymidylate synthase [Armatimonadota bacterium]MDR7471995.1 FAD-dependent thymidylate synthase [Armatimonadota bacterium]MDR7506721.1 FAD-dependent thymidylate synthase [Armatimonadota bacterium]
MRTAHLRVVKVAETRFVLDDREGTPWAVWSTDAADDAAALVEFAGRACYQSWHKPNPATRTNAGYLAHLLSQKHYSVLEHAGFTVMLTGVSRSFTHEMVRHRHFSFSQLSQRFVSEDDAPWVIPPLFRDDPDALAVLLDLYDRVQHAYQALTEIGARKLRGLEDRTLRRKRAREAARCVLPNMTETHIVITGNHRAWREFFEKRGELHVDQEMREVAVTIFREVARPLAPALYRDFRIRVVALPTGPVEVLERDPSLLEDAPASDLAPGGA